jgi:hypothetical protein
MKIIIKILTNLSCFLLFILFSSCKNEAEGKLEQCLKIAGHRFLGGTHRTGGAYGEANFVFEENGKIVHVAYKALSYSADENAKLENMELKEGGPLNTYRIVGDYVVDGGWGQGAKFVFCNFEDEKPNTILIQVTGANDSWAHYDNITLSKEKFLKIKEILSINEIFYEKENNSNKKLETKVKTDGPTTDTNVNSNNEKTDYLIFKNYEEGDLIHYIFEGAQGKVYDFSAIPNKYKLVDDNYVVNPKYYNKKFKIKWKAVPDSGGESGYPYNEIISIELIVL